MTCPTRLIDDIPLPEDKLAFEGDGAHDRVARAMADLILSSEEGGKLIGLEGRWGSGKSTVISLMQKHLASDDIATFVFDAWARERDPLRRSFLESLIGHFQKKQWVGKAQWNNVIRKLAKRRKKTKTRTVSNTTPFGRWLAFSAIFVPSGAAIVAGSFRRGVTLGMGLAPHGWFWLGALLAAAPLWVIVLKLCHILYCYSKGNRVDISSELAVLTGHVDSTATQDTSETPDPTSLEFEREFRDLMDAALSNAECRKAVLVLDNLDRVGPADALSIWSTLQTFLKNRDSDAATWSSRIWIVVPYDRIGLRRVWSTHSATSREERRNDFDDVAESFIDKSLQIRFEVPPPVRSNWREYLYELIGEALPEHGDDDKHDIYRVFKHQIVKESASPTPRELKLYVNQIGALHRQWEHEFPVSHLAYYAALQRDHKTHDEIRDALVGGSIPSKFLRATLRGDLDGNLAGLLFNVKARIGKQLLLSGPIQSALIEKKPEVLRELKSNHENGFWVVLDEVIESGFSEVGPEAICASMECLVASELLEGDGDRHMQTTMRVCADTVQNVTSWSPLTDQTAPGLAAACVLIGETEFSENLMSSLRETLEKEAHESAGTPPLRETLITGLTNLAEQVRNLGHTQAILEPFTLRAEPDEWLETCAEIAKQDPSSWRLFRPHTSFTELTNYICHVIEGGQVSEAVLLAMEIAHRSRFEDGWSGTVAALEQRLDANQYVDAEEGTRLLRALNLAKRHQSKEAQDAYERLASTGHLLHLLYQARQEGHKVCVAWCLSMFLQRCPNGTISGAVGNSAAGQAELENILSTDDPELATEFIAVLADDEIALFFMVAEARGRYEPFVVRCLRHIADSTNPQRVYSSAVVVDRWHELSENLPDDTNRNRFSQLLERLCASTNLVAYVEERGFQVTQSGFYHELIGVGAEQDFIEFCRGGLETVGRDVWTSELREEGAALGLLIAIQECGVSVSLKSFYQDSIVTYAEGLLTGGGAPSQGLMDKKGLVLAPLSRGSRATLRRRLLDAVIERANVDVDGFFKVFGDEICKRSVIDAKKDRVIVLFSTVVRQRTVAGLEWLSGSLEEHRTVLQRSSDSEAVNEFRERLLEEISNEDGGTSEAERLIRRIAALAGVQPMGKRPEQGEAEASSDAGNAN